jgi:hypothetical protein
MDPKYCPYSSKRVEAIVPCHATVTRSTSADSPLHTSLKKADAALHFEGFLLLHGLKPGDKVAQAVGVTWNWYEYLPEGVLVPCAVPEKLYL